MSKKKGGNKNTQIERILLITAILNLANALVSLINKLK